MTLLGRATGVADNCGETYLFGTPAALQILSHSPTMALLVWERGIHTKPIKAEIAATASMPPRLIVNHWFFNEKTRSVFIVVSRQELPAPKFAEAT